MIYQKSVMYMVCKKHIKFMELNYVGFCIRDQSRYFEKEGEGRNQKMTSKY